MKNTDVLPYITALSFEFATSDDYDVKGDEYTVMMAVSDSKNYDPYTNGALGTLYEESFVGKIDENVHPWHRYRHHVELGHYDLTKDQFFHVAINGD